VKNPSCLKTVRVLQKCDSDIEFLRSMIRACELDIESAKEALSSAYKDRTELTEMLEMLQGIRETLPMGVAVSPTVH
jgi:hypothetical protein